MYDDRSQLMASFEYGVISWENLKVGIKGDELSNIGVFSHFLRNPSLNFFDISHNGRTQMASFGYDVIFLGNLNLGKGDYLSK